MLTAQEIQRFAQDGFVRGGQVLNDQQVDALRDELDRVIRDQDRADAPQPVLLHNFCGDSPQIVWQIVNIWEASPAFRELIFHPEMVRAAATLLQAAQLRVWHDQIQYKPQNVGGVNMWHQDAPFWPVLEPKDQQITAWIALDDADQDNGCMSMVPGSQHWGNKIDYLQTLKLFGELPTEYAGQQIVVKPCPVPKGFVHFHHGLTWHGSPANTSGRPRRAIAVHYMTQATHYAALGEHVMKPYITVADGETLQGVHFPLVWSDGRVLQPSSSRQPAPLLRTTPASAV